MVDSYDAFVMTYYILDAAVDKMSSESILNWASDANPFLFKGKGSADPAVYIEFKKAWDEKFGTDSKVDYEECRHFIQSFLSTLSPECAVAFNLVVDNDKWVDDVKYVQKQNKDK